MATSEPKRVGIDAAFRYAVIVAWNDLMKPGQANAIHVKYPCEEGKPVSRVFVWTEKPGGYEDLICEGWAQATSEHPAGTCFEPGHGSVALAQALDFILGNQQGFEHRCEFGTDGLVQVYAPSGDERKEALDWFRTIQGVEFEELRKASGESQ